MSTDALTQQTVREPVSNSLRHELGLIGWQVLYEQRGFWRNRRRAVFSLAFPLMFLVIFGGLNHGARIKELKGLAFINFYVPGMISYAVMVIAFSSMALAVSGLRESGIIKRMRVTPMPWSSYLIGITVSTVLTVLIATVVLLVVGIALYGAELRVEALPGLILTLVLGTACFTSLGIAISRLISKPDSGAPVLMFITLPLSFISNVFFPIGGSKILNDIGKAFPLRPLADGLGPAFRPYAHGTGFVGHDLTTLAIWTVIGLYLMVRTTRQLSAHD